MTPSELHPEEGVPEAAHHLAWVMARALQRYPHAAFSAQLPEDPVRRRDLLAGVFSMHLLPHFVDEEQMFEAHARGKDARLDVLLGQMRAEHRALRAAMAALRDAEIPGEPAFKELGLLLEQHLLFEEQELYPALRALPLDARAVFGRAAAVLVANQAKPHLPPSAPRAPAVVPAPHRSPGRRQP